MRLVILAILKSFRYGLRKDRHSISLLADHLVFSTKCRKPVLTPEMQERCEQIMRSVARDLDIQITSIAIQPEHIHIFYTYPPKHSPSYITMKLKTISSRVLRKEYPELKKMGRHLWEPSNYHGSVGQGFQIVERYIKHQKEHHSD